jgi:thiamine-monophosphate kinase
VCLDVSDGLYIDVARILHAGLGAVLDAELLPLEPGLRQAFPDAWAEVAGGGEDYELLFAGPAGVVVEACRRVAAGGLQATVIGAVDDIPGVRLRVADGSQLPAPSTGHQHFKA